MRFSIFKSLKDKIKKNEKHLMSFLYVGTVLAALVYFFFVSDNNLMRHRQLNAKAEQLEHEIFKLQNYIQNSYSYDEISNNPKLLEQYAREQLNMKKADEDVFIVEYK